MFFSRKVNQALKVGKKKPQTVNQQRAVYRFQSDLCDAGYVGYSRGHLNVRKQRLFSLYKQYQDKHSQVPEDPMRRFDVLKRCKNKFDCPVHEILFIPELRANSECASDSIRVKVFL